MLKNYIKIAFRNLVRHKTFTLINISGLAIGLACCIMIYMFILSETGYDSYHENKENIYRVTLDIEQLSSGNIWKSAATPVLWAPALVRDYPEIIDYCRLYEDRNTWQFRIGEKEYEETNVIAADPSVFDMFTWPLLAGHPKTALTEPYSIVITESIAQKYFPGQDAIGQFILTEHNAVDDSGDVVLREFQFKVTGVMGDVPYKSHVKPDFILSFKTVNDLLGGDVAAGNHPNVWYWRGRLVHTYLLFEDDFMPERLQAKLPGFFETYVGDATTSRGYTYHPYLQRLDGIHLEGDVRIKFERGGDKEQIYLFSVIAFFILAIACMNFMNLSTARSVVRSREVGIRKVVGANRKRLVRQFIGESVFMSVFALLIACILVEFLTPLFYEYIDRQYHFLDQDSPALVIGVAILTLLVGFAAGSYPAFFLSNFQPAHVLKGATSRLSGGARLRKILVVAQFAITVFFIFGSLTVYNQIKYMQQQTLGFKSDQVMAIPPSVAKPIVEQQEAFRNEFLSYSGIKNVTFSSTLPGEGSFGDIWGEPGKAGQEGVSLDEFAVDYDFIDFYGLKLIAGRQFERQRITDAAPPNVDDNASGLEMAGIVNETAVKHFGWASPEAALGKQIRRDPVSNDFTCTVIGVVEDFHFDSLHEEIEPIVLFINPSYAKSRRYVSLQLSPIDMTSTIDFVKEKVSAVLGDTSFDYFFVDENFARQYEEDRKLMEVYGYISALAIFVACLGLFGLATFAAEQRTKEVGIRKVLGASVTGLIGLLSLDFVKLIAISTFVAWPLAYFALSRWLENFAYRFEIGPGTFLISGGLALLIALITVSSQAFKAAVINPAQSLRYE